MSNASNNFPPFPFAGCLMVDPTLGNDNTGQRGSLSQAFSTIAAAVAASIAGDTILLAAGTHTVNTSILLKANQTLQGQGIDCTKLLWTVDGVSVPNKWVCIEVASNCTVQDLTVTCNQIGAGKFQACIGVHTGWGGAGASGFTVRNFRGVGDSDVVYFRNDNAYSGKFFNCILESGWDVVAIFNSTNNLLVAHALEFFGCRSKSTGNHTASPNLGNQVAIDCRGATAWFTGCYVDLTGGTSAHVVNMSTTQVNESVFLTGCRVLNPSSTVDIALTDSTHTVRCIATNVFPSRVTGNVSSAVVSFDGCPIDSMTTTVRNNVTADYAVQRGTCIYNTTVGALQIFDGVLWQSYLNSRPGRRITSLRANGTNSTQMGDAATAAGAAAGTVAPTATEGVTRDESSATVSGNPFGTVGNLNYRTGTNIYFAAKLKLSQITNQRVWYGVSDLTLTAGAGMGSADAIAGNYAAFRASSGTDTKFQCICMDNAVQTVVNSNINIDTAIHLFEIVMNDSATTPTVQFFIDGVLVATISSHLPLAATNLRYVVGGNTSDVAVHHLLWEYITLENDR